MIGNRKKNRKRTSESEHSRKISDNTLNQLINSRQNSVRRKSYITQIEYYRLKIHQRTFQRQRAVKQHSKTARFKCCKIKKFKLSDKRNRVDYEIIYAVKTIYNF